MPTNWVDQFSGLVNTSNMLNGGRTGDVSHDDGVGASSGAADARCNIEVTDSVGNHSPDGAASVY